MKPGGGIRRQARELAVQFLYQYDLSGVIKNPNANIEEGRGLFWMTQDRVPDAVRAFADELITGVTTHRAGIDEKIAHYTEHWELSRIAAVDRNVLRLAMYEMLFREDIPPVVSINEAVEIAKRFSTRESGAFVNGILDRLKLDLPRPARTASGNRAGSAG